MVETAAPDSTCSDSTQKRRLRFQAAAVYRFSLIRKTLSFRKGSLRTHQRLRRKPRVPVSFSRHAAVAKVAVPFGEKRVECGQTRTLGVKWKSSIDSRSEHVFPNNSAPSA